MDTSYKELSELTMKAYELSDEKLAEESKKLFDKFPSAMRAYIYPLENIIYKRIITYCKTKGIPSEEYDGPLVFKS